MNPPAKLSCGRLLGHVTCTQIAIMSDNNNMSTDKITNLPWGISETIRALVTSKLNLDGDTTKIKTTSPLRTTFTLQPNYIDTTLRQPGL
jgi:hypothetical protein